MASSKMLTRDVKRRVKVIQSKIEDLQNMGIPSAFVYLTNWTGGLYVSGDERIPKEIKLSADTILKNLQGDEEKGDLCCSNFCLPRLPNKLELLNNKTIASMLVGLGKDLKINWKGDAPLWWPESVPFQHPREAAPETFKGKSKHVVNACNINLILQEVGLTN